MYLSRLILNPMNARVQRELAQPYEVHRFIMRAFGQQLEERGERVLWRLDEHPATGLSLLVQSHEAPDWSWLAGQETRGYLRAVPEPNPAVKPFAPQLAVRQLLAFRLRANPTRRLSAGRGHAGKRVGVYDEEEQLAWLDRKGGQNGFRLLKAHVNQGGKFVSEKSIRRSDQVHKLEMYSVQFDGVLQVTDPDLLLQAVRNGIGSGKGFGFGLLSLALVR